MKYFTRQQHDAINSDDRNAVQAAIKDFEICCERYRHQLSELQARLPESVWAFFDSVSLHDGTLLAMRVGDDIDKQFSNYGSLLVNKRHLSVELEVLNHEETRLYALRYDGLHRVTFDFPSSEPWYLRFGNPGGNPIDDWMADELTGVDDRVLRHEVLFSSGATVMIEFERLSVRNSEVEGRQGLPYLDPADPDASEG